KDPEVADFVRECQAGGVSEAELESMEKKGLPLDIDAIHPVSGERVPIFVANFVLMGYGSGAVMAVPAHDQRDWEFAAKYDIPRRQVVHAADGSPCGIDERAWTGRGILKDSGPFDGLTSESAMDMIADWLSERGLGGKEVHYRLRDWGVSRQRYWGCPVPVIRTAEGAIAPAPELPVTLPEDVMVDGSGSPLVKMAEFFDLGDGNVRETDTFDTFFESSWYYARYCSHDCDTAMLDERAQYWLPVDQYVGGIEHAVLHLLYARFFNRLMRDEGLVDCDEPFTRLLTQGMVVAETYYREDASRKRHWYNPAEVEVERDGHGRVISAVLTEDGQPVTPGGVEKMSKSKNNGIDPQALINRYGADTVRLYTMFTAPPDQSLEWSDDGVEGANRFLRRLWALALRHSAGNAGLPEQDNRGEAQRTARREIHATLKKALYDFERQQFNTVVSACMTMVNTMYKLGETDRDRAVLREGLGIVLRLLGPIAPHVTHFLWREFEFGEDILDAGWPEADEDALRQESVEYIVQVNGKVRGKVSVDAGADREAVEAAARESENVVRFLGEKSVRKVIVVPGRLVNIVAS
ncbi:MAG: leucine--tRNA ligase, partial [Pseudomonadota bacterium]|nr:leucine--tRNA ligase [Pseudomonadota bacterium]